MEESLPEEAEKALRKAVQNAGKKEPTLPNRESESLKEKPDFKPLPEIKLYDRADGVKGHFCVGQDRDGITEYWTGREFSGFGRLYTSEQEAIDMRDLLVLYRDHRNRAHDLQKELILAKEEIERLKQELKNK